MKRILILFLSLIPLFSVAETFEGRIVEKLSNKKEAPLPGASVFWKNTSTGTATDVNGRFTIDKSNKSDILVVQFVGYETREIEVKKLEGENLVIEMSPNIELNEVVVSKRRAGTVLDRENPIQSQSITGAELCKAACCNLAESFETNASVDVSYADAATGAKSIKLLGLTGKYIEMMTEKNPNFKGLASVYGMVYVPGPWMESIQVSKGVGSVVNGFESITGQINIEYQKPQNAPVLYLNGYTNSMGMSEGNLISGVKFSDNLSTSILAHGQDNTKEIDHNNDHFLDDPMVRQYNIVNRWYWKPNKDWITQFGVKFIDEQRIGGQKGYDESKTNDLNNAYRIDIDTRRYEAFAKIGYVFPKNDERSIALITNFSSHEQKSFYGLKNYDANQKYLYANLLFQSYIGNLNHKYTAGLSFIYDDFNDNLYKTVNNQNEINPFKPKGTNRSEKIAGAYAEYTWLPSDEITLQAGLRYDHNSVYGGFVTPRLHFRYNFAEGSTLRLAAGSGRRTANPIAENSFLLASNRTFNIQADLEQEKAWNYGLSVTQYFNLFGQDFTASADFYRTEFQNQVIVDVDQNINEVSFYNLDGQSFANNYQVELKFEPVDRLDVTTALRFSDVKADINNEFQTVPYVNRYKGLVNLSYSTNMNIWQFDFTTQINGDMRIPSAPEEFIRREKSPAYAMLNAQVTKRFKIWEVYFGAENLGNYTQKHPIIDAGDPFGGNFDASMIWGPIQERKFYLGVRLTIDRD
ncbi:TonB-dependent receptor [Ancylomarina euxinus]|uniref:TonB-dependent receptor n=1 Tax=Ancylomarina euxinus TaxID=2283627 RepID=A0A425XY71_9BACT|nr:TonB-dependent receptor [Ancylomarina euxinus]MCZ4695939.1 TonB-dependent receptor [Ancylomarina euxinus]MUP16311.1 TonB-dependent receptor [Ancylomarina euxinus]RRG19707.1 TonB-dependent receptor [Ancylomarina euxinus]